VFVSNRDDIDLNESACIVSGSGHFTMGETYRWYPLNGRLNGRQIRFGFGRSSYWKIENAPSGNITSFSHSCSGCVPSTSTRTRKFNVLTQAVRSSVMLMARCETPENYRNQSCLTALLIEFNVIFL